MALALLEPTKVCNSDMTHRNLILCVDDEPLLLRTLAIAVPRAGFRVAVAENGAAGLQLFLQRRTEICLVVSDIIMPLMSGREMVERILRMEPHTKVLLMSAYSDDVIGRQVRNQFQFIRKPFVRSTLIEKIRSIVAVPEFATSST
jgi:DNA-binding NtrC family response regulator